ncbi:MJ0042 family finger-like domain-containing protein [Bradyrhizobium lablabi]|uniref:MJ0042 family finger-like domain-containing protein n=1 Tax=Bradyrhizobium lablabi TaxID=722472 RepID=A0A1M6XT40_9BRAD|nr:MJ0042-type zinc finger domain-containing protein [Bradyrhizobium lablabi]SHL09043.1 MJ0042 family finger-like domain-containing protein [Bradyrhizobium lablabi]
MHIICPHCTTSYAIDPATLGGAGRTVRCSRCKEVWMARREDAIEIAAPAAAMAASGQGAGGTDDAAAEWEALAREENEGSDTPVVDSPSISGDWPVDGESSDQSRETDWASMARGEMDDAGTARRGRSWLGKLLPRPRIGGSGKPLVSLPTACAAMGALVLALTIWRVDMVRLLPQTATFYKMAGLEVNLRGLMFKDVKVTSETVEGKPVLVIEGVIVGEGRKTVELPRLRFSVRDAQGAEIYAWNAVLEQPVLKPGERASFKSRLASPPPEGRQIDVRFFNKRDLATGNV